MTTPTATDRMVRAMRSLDDGHLTLYAQVQYFDPYTGDELAEPRLLYVGHNRYDLPWDWWKPFLAAGLIALPPRGHGSHCTLTEAGRVWLAEHDTTEEN